MREKPGRTPAGGVVPSVPVMHARWFALGLGLSSAAALAACGHPPDVRHPTPQIRLAPPQAAAAWNQVQDVFERRCVVCHGCYDAPCQLKLDTFEGIDRGASDNKVYDPTRLIGAEPTRLGIDAHGRAAWREKKFHPVVAEGEKANLRASLLLRMLDLKHEHPLEASVDVAKEFTFELDRKQTCTTQDKFDAYAKEHPRWGMPYALPEVTEDERKALTTWVLAGAPHPPAAAPVDATERAIASWETFLNDASPKGQLAARYIYEHLFLASIRMDDTGKELFRLVRSRTAPGEAVDEIATRRPFDDPKVERVYYRFVRREGRPLEKTHMPYALSPERLARYRAMFLETPYDVLAQPGYEPEIAANPFRAFEAIPSVVRYRFMLEEAEFTIMGFIKGPVCRGQVALNVIEDRFWVTFVSPDVPWAAKETAFLSQQKGLLDMPAEAGSTTLGTAWFGFAKNHVKYASKHASFFTAVTEGGKLAGTQLLWDGDGQKNTNAALTVLRHFDNATVVRGLVGGPPKTAWVIDYPLLERIHYLLVAGYDVFGNVSHQLVTRLYMDFLRLEGEAGFLSMVPSGRRKPLVNEWYRGVKGDAKAKITTELTTYGGPPPGTFPQSQPELQVFAAMKARLGRAVAHGFDLDKVQDPEIKKQLLRLEGARGLPSSFLPESSFVTVELEKGARYNFTILRDSAHTNVAELFREESRRVPTEDVLTVVPGLLGAYPNALYDVKRADLAAFVDAALKLDGEPAYRALRTRFGVLRPSPRFWEHSDHLAEDRRQEDRLYGGLFDFNRLEPY